MEFFYTDLSGLRFILLTVVRNVMGEKIRRQKKGEDKERGPGSVLVSEGIVPETEILPET